MIKIPKLYFKYGCMGSSKTAQALMTKFNYNEKGYRVALMKPSVDNRDGTTIIKSRIGLSDECILITPSFNFMSIVNDYDVFIIDETQFLTSDQVDELKLIAINYIPVLCFGLKTDFQTHLFEGSKRLLEIADSVTEIKSICKCGRKADVNARIDTYNNVITNGNQIEIGGNDKYIGMCYDCWIKATNKNKYGDDKNNCI